MAKYRIIGEGNHFQDDWGLNSIDACAVRINGNVIERLSKCGTWFPAYNAGQPIEKLLWAENGSIHAVLKNGSIREHAAHLPSTPGKTPIPWEYNAGGSDRTSATSSSSRRGSQNSKFFGPGWWWKWPFKLIWAIVKWPLKVLWTLFSYIFIAQLVDAIFGKKRV
ncbi:MAG: hypothetical protein K2L39_08195 [Muribaculaceae bacterium]|nr:hypothetical protein [Muribaculaceae bacterium]